MKILVAIWLAIGSMTVAAPRSVNAHHSFAADFDAEKPIKLTGPVTKVEWTNPHVWFYGAKCHPRVRNNVLPSSQEGQPDRILRSGSFGLQR
jgi:hypothetical protein